RRRSSAAKAEGPDTVRAFRAFAPRARGFPTSAQIFHPAAIIGKVFIAILQGTPRVITFHGALRPTAIAPRRSPKVFPPPVRSLRRFAAAAGLAGLLGGGA